MAKIMTRQTSLKKAFWVKSIPGLFSIIAGITLIIVMFSKEKEDILQIIVGAFLFVVGISLILRNRTFLSGAKGEKLVSKTLGNFPDDWYIFNDVVIRDTQIDHILICPKGVYVIETKHYRGTISGDAEDTDWWQLISSRQIQRYNPVRQTLHHAVALANYIRDAGYSKVWVEPLIVFSHPEVKLKVVSPKVPVICLSRLSDFLNSRPQMIGSQKCEEISIALNNYLVGNIRKNRFVIQWLPASLIIVAVLGVLWSVITMKSVPNQEPTLSSQESVIPWEKASNYVGHKKTVKGRIVKINKSNRRWFLNFAEDDDKNALSIVIFSEDVGKFQPSLDDLYTDRVILVKGKIKKDEWGLEIIVNSPEQIERVGEK